METFFLTPEQKKLFKGYYIISGSGLLEFGDCTHVDRNNFKAIYFSDDILKVLTVDDFAWYAPRNNNKDFFIKDIKFAYLLREKMPKKIVKLLDSVIEEKILKEHIENKK